MVNCTVVMTQPTDGPILNGGMTGIACNGLFCLLGELWLRRRQGLREPVPPAAGVSSWCARMRVLYSCPVPVLTPSWDRPRSAQFGQTPLTPQYLNSLMRGSFEPFRERWFCPTVALLALGMVPMSGYSDTARGMRPPLVGGIPDWVVKILLFTLAFSLLVLITTLRLPDDDYAKGDEPLTKDVPLDSAATFPPDAPNNGSREPSPAKRATSRKKKTREGAATKRGKIKRRNEAPGDTIDLPGDKLDLSGGRFGSWSEENDLPLETEGRSFAVEGEGTSGEKAPRQEQRRYHASAWGLDTGSDGGDEWFETDTSALPPPPSPNDGLSSEREFPRRTPLEPSEGKPRRVRRSKPGSGHARKTPRPLERVSSKLASASCSDYGGRERSPLGEANKQAASIVQGPGVRAGCGASSGDAGSMPIESM